MDKSTKLIYYILGLILIIVGIYLSIFQRQAHFYSLYSVGFLIIFWTIYNSKSKTKLFKNFKTWHKIFFWVILTIACLIIDKLGIYLGYWIYPNYKTIFDEIIKYLFEWIAPLVYSMILFKIGLNQTSEKIKLKNILIAFGLILIFGIFTEYINLFSNSWKIISMPITNFKIGQFFLIFQTIGYWLIAIIPFCIYELTKKLFK